MLSLMPFSVFSRFPVRLLPLLSNATQMKVLRVDRDEMANVTAHEWIDSGLLCNASTAVDTSLKVGDTVFWY